jgi:hypothetical protein
MKKICKKCGRVWELKSEKLPFRDKDSIKCTCGEELLSWNGGICYQSRLVQDTPQKKRKSN